MNQLRAPAQEYKVVSIRECPVSWKICDTPDLAADYWRASIQTADYFNPDVEFLVAVFVSCRRHIRGHTLVSMGCIDSSTAHPISVFRPALIASIPAIILMHNHPSGDPVPSEADVKVTRELVRGGQLLKVEILDHVIMGDPRHGKGWCSLRELGYFAI